MGADAFSAPIDLMEAGMTSREVISTLLSGQQARIGLYENIWPDTLQNWSQQGYPIEADPAEYFGMDIGRIGAAFDPSPRPGYNRIIEETSSWQIVEDGFGAVSKRFKGRSATPGHIDWAMRDRSVWESRFKPALMELDEKRIPATHLSTKLKQYRADSKWICFNMSFIWEGFRQAVGDVCMYESLLDDPEWILDFNETMLRLYTTHIARTIELVGKPDGIWLSEDLAYNQGLFCAPSVLEKLYMPYYRRFNEFAHANGLKVILHSCGDITSALPLIIEAGFDALHPLQIHAGCDPFQIAAKYGRDIALIGGLDAHVIETNDLDLIRSTQTALIQGMRRANARYIFSSDHSLSTNVNYYTYRAILDTYHALAERS